MRMSPDACLHHIGPARGLIGRYVGVQVAWWSRASASSPTAWQHSQPVPLGLEGPLRCADVAAGRPCQLRVLAVRQAEPSQAAVIALTGNPTVLRPDGVCICFPLA